MFTLFLTSYNLLFSSAKGKNLMTPCQNHSACLSLWWHCLSPKWQVLSKFSWLSFYLSVYFERCINLFHSQSECLGLFSCHLSSQNKCPINNIRQSAVQHSNRNIHESQLQFILKLPFLMVVCDFGIYLFTVCSLFTHKSYWSISA